MNAPDGVDTPTASGAVLVLTDSAQRYHPMLRSLRWQAAWAGVTLREVDPASRRSPPAGPQIIAVTAVGPHLKTAAQYAIQHGLIHLELDESSDAGHLGAALRTTPDRSTVISVDVDDETRCAIDRVDIECDDPIDIAVDQHEWFDIRGPVFVHNTNASDGDVWITIQDGPMTVLSASPPLASSIHVTSHGHADVRIDGRRRFTAPRSKLTVSFPFRRRSIRFGTRTHALS